MVHITQRLPLQPYLTMEDHKTPIKEYFAKVVKVFGMPGLVAIGYFLMNNWLEGYRSTLFITGGSATGKSSKCIICQSKVVDHDKVGLPF